MGSTWRKVKLALGLNLRTYVPRTLEDPLPPCGDASTERFSDAALLSPLTNWDMGWLRPMTPTPSSHGLKLSKSGNKSSKQTCSICLTKIKQGGGQAIFTAECSHSFHFQCIASCVNHGNQICPVCRAKWKEIPSQADRLPSDPFHTRRHVVPLSHPPEPGVFDDDDSLDRSQTQAMVLDNDSSSSTTIEIKAFPELTAFPRTKSYDQFAVLVHLTAKHDTIRQNNRTLSRTPVDLVTVLDISGSMAGTKLALLKRAMGFVIQNLSSSDRLSVIAFSSTARRLFPLRRMTDSGRHQALQAVNSLITHGGTNIAEGLRKGAKVLSERKQKNPVASIILLSDGQDTYSVNNFGSGDRNSKPNYQLLLPVSIPVHTFGFGSDHDASSMHSISETSGGTFSFIETEAAIQDAFAQCIGGILSVVVQELQVSIATTNQTVKIGSIRSGSYPNRVSVSGKTGNIDVGDLYADEERNFLVSMNVPAERSGDETRLMKVTCVYKDPFSKEMVTLESDEIRLSRPENVVYGSVSVEVDRQRNRLQAALAMARARAVAEEGDLGGAALALEGCRKALLESVSGKCRDPLCVALDAELKEMQERLASRHVYEASGRAYILSGLSSHSWQRATARGDSTDGSSLVRAYQTPLMTEMLTRSQSMLLGSPSSQRLLEPLWPLRFQPKPR